MNNIELLLFLEESICDCKPSYKIQDFELIKTMLEVQYEEIIELKKLGSMGSGEFALLKRAIRVALEDIDKVKGNLQSRTNSSLLSKSFNLIRYRSVVVMSYLKRKHSLL